MKTPVLPFSTQLLFLSLPSPPNLHASTHFGSVGVSPLPTFSPAAARGGVAQLLEREERNPISKHACKYLLRGGADRKKPANGAGMLWRHAGGGRYGSSFPFPHSLPAHEMPKPDWPSRRKGRSACSPERGKEVAYGEMERGEKGELMLKSFQV